MSKKVYELLPGVLRNDIVKTENSFIENLKYTCYTNEVRILRHFIQEATPYIKIPSNDLSRWLEIAQHYGIPTRLLDWTENPLVALYFACRENKECDAQIWLLHRMNYYEEWKEQEKNMKIKEIVNNLLNGSWLDVKYPIIYTPYYFDSRMSAQSSCFMLWGTDYRPFDKIVNSDCYLDYTTVDCDLNVAGTTDRNKFLFRIFVKSISKQKIIRQLDVLGINEKTLFPGLDGIGKYIEGKYRFDYQEACDNF